MWSTNYLCLALLFSVSIMHNVKPSQQLSLAEGTIDYGDDDNTDMSLNRVRRTAMAGASRRYKYGIVPYEYDSSVTEAQKENIRWAMQVYENLTCIRFVKRLSDCGVDAKTRFNLGHNGFVKFVQTDNCFGGKGNNNRQTSVSCCGKKTCIHELGHALGQLHEQQSPNRDGFIRVNPNVIPHAERIRYLQVHPWEVESQFPFDISSPMNYKYDILNGPQILLATDLNTAQDPFYMFMEISYTHQCKANNCSSFPLTCVNDGYVTMVQNECACRCPPGLDPTCGCSKPIIPDGETAETCGGVFELNDTQPLIRFRPQTSRGTACTWLFNAKEGDHITLEFSFFNVKRSSNKCEDKVEIRPSRIGQPAIEHCGFSSPKSVKSIFNRLSVRMITSDDKSKRSNFQAVVKLVSAKTLCYNPKDKGYTYAGTVNYARDYTPCIKWADASNCPHNPYNFEDITANLESNYCRNPGNGLTPWCYTSTRLCQRKYCDVCTLDQLYNNENDCYLKRRYTGYCTKFATSRKECAKTCRPYLFPKKSSVVNVTCGQPPSLTSSIQVDGLDKSTFKVGDAVTYKCDDRIVNRQTQLKKYCLSTGEWSQGNTACLPCHLEKDWVLYKNACYSIRLHKKKALQHASDCRNLGGSLADVRSMDEQKFITALAFSKGAHDVYIGATDMLRERQFIFQDGSELTWENWDRRSRNSDTKDCAWSNFAEKWVHGDCNVKTSAVCKVDAIPRSGCFDVRSDCQELLRNNRYVCSNHKNFAYWQCAKTCRKC